MNLSLTGKNAFVCGSTQGIGKASAIELAKLGANVTLIARNEEKLKTVVTELDNSQGQKHDFIQFDFSDASNLENTLESYLKQTSKNIHILVNNTGGPPAGLLTNANTSEFLQAMNNHLVCNHILMQAVVDGMKTDSYGRIINIISTSVKIPIAGLGVSNTTRGAVASWAKTLANELGQFGITVNNVLPGFTATARLASIISNRAKKANSSEEEAANKMKAGVPANRFGTSEEIANVVAFLASPAAAYVNGVSMPVDGGRTGCI